MDDLDTLKRDRFELLSAYLDGEVTADERKQVEVWLDTDPEIQSLYHRLTQLKHGFQSLPVTPSQSAEQTVNRVFERLERRPKAMLVWTGMGAAIAATFVGILSGILPNSAPFPQLAQTTPARVQPKVDSLSQTPAEQDVHSTMLMLALDRPPVAIPAGLNTGSYSK
jgi:anti-sigma factor RsiW